VNVLYAMPSHGAMDAAERGEIALGGCCPPWELAHYRCQACARTGGPIPTSPTRRLAT